MTNKERNQLKQEITYRDVMTKKVGTALKIVGSIFLLSFALTFWGFTNLHDNFLNVSDSVRNVIKWVSLVVAIPSGVLTIMFALSFRNSKKYTLELIDKLKGKK